MTEQTRHRWAQRCIAVTVILLFATLSLVASGPHPHDFPQYSTAQAVQHRHADGPACPLCDWVAHSTAIVSLAPVVISAPIQETLPFHPVTAHTATLATRQPTGRAPPARLS